MRYRDLLRKTKNDLKACVEVGAPEWLVSYAKASMAKASYFHAGRRTGACALRMRAMNELLQLGDMLRYWKWCA